MRLGKNPRLVAENREFDKTGEEEEHEKRFAQNHESFELRGFKSSAGSCAAAKPALLPTAELVELQIVCLLFLLSSLTLQ